MNNNYVVDTDEMLYPVHAETTTFVLCSELNMKKNRKSGKEESIAKINTRAVVSLSFRKNDVS